MEIKHILLSSLFQNRINGRLQLHLEIKLLVAGFYFSFSFPEIQRSTAFKSTFLAVFRLRQETCNQRFYLTHQKREFSAVRYHGLPGAGAAAMFSICAADLGTARVIESVTFFNIPSFVAEQVRRLPHPQSHFSLSLLRMSCVEKKPSEGWLRQMECDTHPAASWREFPSPQKCKRRS